MKHKVLIIDDDRELLALIQKYLVMENYEVAFSSDGESGLEAALAGEYQLVILDVMLPNRNGFEVLTQLRKYSPVPVLMLTARDSEIDKVSGLRMGADDYLTKPFSMNELIARVQSLIRRYTLLGQPEREEKRKKLEFENLSINRDTREVAVDGRNVMLTAKEFDLLFFLAENAGRVFTKKQIYNQVWEDTYAYDDNNIMVHIRRLRKKIEKDSEAPVYVQTVWGVGYKFGKGSKP